MKNLQDIARLDKRAAFTFVEHAQIHVKGNNVSIWAKDGIVDVPANQIATLMLGPGTSITHEAIKLLFENNVQVIWCGKEGLIFYAHGIGGTYKSENLLKQAKAWADPITRLKIAKDMFQRRFSESVENKTIEDLRVLEGQRVRMLYQTTAAEVGLKWEGRSYNPNDPTQGDLANRLLTAANACLYAVCHSVIITLGYSPAIGFVHTGNQKSFIFDIADLYKAEYAIHMAFETACHMTNLDYQVLLRSRLQWKIKQDGLIQTMIEDVNSFFKEVTL